MAPLTHSWDSRTRVIRLTTQSRSVDQTDGLRGDRFVRPTTSSPSPSSLHIPPDRDRFAAPRQSDFCIAAKCGLKRRLGNDGAIDIRKTIAFARNLPTTSSSNFKLEIFLNR